MQHLSTLKPLSKKKKKVPWSLNCDAVTLQFLTWVHHYESCTYETNVTNYNLIKLNKFQLLNTKWTI